MSATEAVIHFIGIVMLTASVPNDPGVKAIVPRIEGFAVESATQRVGRGRRSSEPVRAVEPHVAAIIYEKSDKLGISNWTPANFRETWEYVVLQHERLQFVTSAANGTPSIPRDLPHACSTMTLQAPFQPPHYTSAAAVVDIPEGSLEVCVARQSNDSPSGGRADTRLFLKTNGSFVIVATNASEPAKTITLKPDATVFLVNIPPTRLDIETPLTSLVESLPHHQAYDAMGGTSNCTHHLDVSNVCKSCDESLMKKRRPARSGSSLPEIMIIDSECSNSQWP
ncbi:MAG TPA: hypothetical protein VGQ36_12750 [Thermoanaerobaculia bacterium]|jgi:hypothetical protein|nr:hypothetical protein [Thermoanaerobaculia bacterium]